MSDWLDELEAWGSRLRASGAVSPGPSPEPPPAWPTAWGPEHVETWPEVEPGPGRRPQARARACPQWLPCRHCEDSGHLFSEDGGYRYASPCRCQDLRARIEAYDRAALPPEGHARRADQLDWSGREAQLRAVRAYVGAWSANARGLLLHGPTGTGKSHVLCAVGRHLTLTRAVKVRYVVWPELRDDVYESLGRDAHAGRSGIRSVLEPLGRAELLIVDELGGGGPTTEFTAGVLEVLIGRRLERAGHSEGGAVLLATNLDPYARPQDPMGLTAALGQRTVSRLMGGCDVVAFTGADWRRRGQSNGEVGHG